MSYQDYLQSEWWKRRRALALMLAHYECRKCKRDHYLEVHHRNYERLGRERDSDLEVLCRVCHGDRHWQKREDWITTPAPVWDGPTHIGEIVPFIYAWMISDKDEAA